MENAWPLELEVLPGRFAIHRFDPAEPVPEAVLASPFFNIETLRRLPIGESLDLSFAFPSYEETISLSCHVARSAAKGINIRIAAASSRGGRGNQGKIDFHPFCMEQSFASDEMQPLSLPKALRFDSNAILTYRGYRQCPVLRS